MANTIKLGIINVDMYSKFSRVEHRSQDIKRKR